MYDAQFTQTILERLGCADLEGKNDEVVATMHLPLTQLYTFGVESNGVVDFKKQETGSRRTIRRELTPEHVVAYKENLEVRLRHYQRLVERNKLVNSHYETPTFGVDDAATMAQEALFGSFSKVRQSYQQKQ
ncbi:hypothetical protein HYV86_07865 [Candidatus Woesearchaeota archaeon]|nr:hypothetical protein [Candidatus Woesearchaeota archaeon]